MSQQLVARDGLNLSLSSEFIKDNWNNYDNAQFYENIPLEILQGYAKAGGLDTGADLEIIKPHIINAKSILEVGAGYGRVVNHILNWNDFTGKISALERCANYINLLKLKFDNEINLYHTDLHSFESVDKYDVVLWLWAGLCEFTPNEQPEILEKLISALHPNGVLALDSLLPTINPANATYSENQYHVIQGDSWMIHTYIPSLREIDLNLENLKAKSFNRIIYQTGTLRTRVLYLIHK